MKNGGYFLTLCSKGKLGNPGDSNRVHSIIRDWMNTVTLAVGLLENFWGVGPLSGRWKMIGCMMKKLAELDIIISGRAEETRRCRGGCNGN